MNKQVNEYINGWMKVKNPNPNPALPGRCSAAGRGAAPRRAGPPPVLLLPEQLPGAPLDRRSALPVPVPGGVQVSAREGR